MAPFISMQRVDVQQLGGIIARWDGRGTFVVGLDAQPGVSTQRSCKVVINWVLRLWDVTATCPTVPGRSERLAEVIVHRSNHCNTPRTTSNDELGRSVYSHEQRRDRRLAATADRQQFHFYHLNAILRTLDCSLYFWFVTLVCIVFF